MQIIGTLAAFFIPESPKYLFKKKMVEQTAKVLQIIATINGKDRELVSDEIVRNAIKEVEEKRN